MKSGILGLALVMGSVAMGCSASTTEDASSNDSAITGVTDLSEVEAGMGLWTDTKDANGKYSRTDAKLQAGPCYKKQMGGADAANVQFRRYTNGAAFFRKAGTGPASGAERPLLCVDVDVDYSDDGTQPDTLMVSDIEVDAVLRYRLGAPTGGDGALGTFYDGFKNGSVRYHGASCPEGGFDPLASTAMASWCFGGVDFPGNQNANGALQLLVYRYAYRNAQAANRYSAASDAVGRFVSMEDGDSMQHIRFEKMDGHAYRSPDGKVQTVTITPKGSDANIAAKAVATCTLTDTDDESYKADCKGI